MNESVRLLDEAKALTGSDRQTALRIRTDSQTLSHIRTGQYAMNDTLAARIGELIGIGWQEAVAAVNQDRARNKEDKDYWKGLAATCSVILSIGAVCAFGFGSESYAAALPLLFAPEIYIMRINKRHRVEEYAATDRGLRHFEFPDDYSVSFRSGVAFADYSLVTSRVVPASRRLDRFEFEDYRSWAVPLTLDDLGIILYHQRLAARLDDGGQCFLDVGIVGRLVVNDFGKYDVALGHG